MRIIAETTDFQLLAPSAVAIGKFDGLHRGHRELINRVLKAKARGLLAVIFTFDPPPEVLFGQRQQKELTTKEEKRRVLEKLGIDILIEFPLTRETAAIPPRDFVEQILCKQMKMAYLAAGADITFGDKGAGDAALLKELAPLYGARAEIVDKVCEGAREISSTYVREEVEKGNMEQAHRLLGEPYQVIGQIMHGAKLGRRIGMPTINLLPEEEKLLPPNGVYYSRTVIGGREYKSITNIGQKPTVSQQKQTGVETYIYEFDRDVYGKTAVVKLLKFKRPEMKFDDLESLKDQMMQDVEAGRNF
jgi:riboflavin kinase/FMN adenylyltransferase